MTRLGFGTNPSPVLGVVSHALPPGSSGFQYMLEALLGDLPQTSVALVGMTQEKWGGRARVRIPVWRPPRSFAESVTAAVTTAGATAAAGATLPRIFPGVRRIFATLDPTLGIALAWARATGAELWVYGIDLHASSFWRARGVMRGTLEKWRTEALGEATRTFGLSGRMGAWMVAHGARGPVEVLPPLAEVGPPAPMPEGPPMFLYSGWIYGANAEPLRWLQRAVADLAPAASLRLVTHAPVGALRAAGLDLDRWSVSRADGAAEVNAAVARATWGVIALDPNHVDRPGLQVAWPTKLREYLAVGRPVLCIAGDDYAAADITRAGGWGLVARSEEETRNAVVAALGESRESLERRARLAHAFALTTIDNRTVGAAWRARALEGAQEMGTPAARGR